MAKSDNKTMPTPVSVLEFLQQVDVKKLADSQSLIAMMERLTGEPATMWGPSIIGFGTYHYQYDSGRKGSMCRIGFSPRKDKFSLYVHTGFEAAESILPALGKVTKKVGCIYFKKLADLDLAVLEQLIQQSLAHTRQLWG